MSWLEDGEAQVRTVGEIYKGHKTTKGKSVGNLRGTSLYIRVGNTGTGRETGIEDTYSRKQLVRKDMQNNQRR